ncbi:MAG: threonine--tRNA ligase [Xanthomonadales bacterium]|nr:threonine--tRNA ligase [Gammaproteobacteria bacterium]MBT8054114.1 threonine--tRNA ligase [Gammaproteobacteria bacterium]NND56135.1 threonine--tRNA ligase [Xanthomonadales bacterium]NNK51638.1 threonine--tRNA ligase [Xanthomonadales bacterium]
MPAITLPDGSQRQFEQPVTVMEVAADIGAGLAKATLAGEVDGVLRDASHLIEGDADLRIVTGRDPEGLDVIRHSTAHLMAQAVERLYPECQVTIGPVIEHGFYYDFSYPPGFTMEDLDRIGSEMRRIVKDALPVSREVWNREEAIQHFRQEGELYKAEIIEDLPEGEEITLYRQGEFVDLCRGPHVPDTGKLGEFKLTKLAGAYWRGNSDNEMLQRIYGTAWANKKDLKAYLHRLEEAEKRDHRRVGKQLDLFHFQEEAPGMVFWHDKGWQIYVEVQNYIRAQLRRAGYQEVNTPQVVDIRLWEKSGHADKFIDDMFLTDSENRNYAIKPMNCPCHVQIYNQGLHSYRDLPMRMAEFGSCHRNEPSGALHGLMRVRAFAQDDAHIFCTPEQVQQESADFIELLYRIYADFGFNEVLVKLSTRPENRIGADELWDQAEAMLAASLDEAGIAWEENPGEGAFYGPKIEFSLKDTIGRVWQCGTLQVDFNMPGRLGASYVDEDSSRQTPVMLHRAILGSLERFIGILIENYGGAFPAWLAPVQAVVLNISEKQEDYCLEVAETLGNKGFRMDSDLRNEKIGFKIRQHTMSKVPYLLVVGDREVENGTIAVRSRSGEDLGSMPVDEFAQVLADDVGRRGRIENQQED